MRVDINKFIGFCGCGKEHKIMVKDIIIESEAIKKLSMIMEKEGFKNITIICDENTYAAAGEEIKEIIPKGKFINLKSENLHANELEYHPEIDKMLDAIQWHNLNKIADCMGNVLETVTIPHYPVIQKIKDHMKEHGALNAMMSGSGPTVFGLFDDKATAENACEALRESRLARTVFLTTVFNNGGRRK